MELKVLEFHSVNNYMEMLLGSAIPLVYCSGDMRWNQGRLIDEETLLVASVGIWAYSRRTIRRLVVNLRFKSEFPTFVAK